jgi:23S rRNA (cytidine2498-2'-O)-methyltransferase
MHIFLSEPDATAFLVEEMAKAFPHAGATPVRPGWVAGAVPLHAEMPPTLVFARQLLPDAIEHRAETVNAWAECVWSHAIACLEDGRPWRLHVAAHYGGAHAGANRCRLIHEAVVERLRRKRRYLLRALVTEPRPFTPEDTLIQLVLAGPDAGRLSLARAPTPFDLRRVISPFPAGEVPIAVDKSVPSRAFAKLVEAEQRLGVRIGAGDRCVDLGAAPGGWSAVALARGARVVAVDRAPLREDLTAHPRLRFHRGDAFAFVPDGPVDWLLCDVIAAPQRSIGLLLDWVRHRRARRFVVTIKFRGQAEYAALERLKHALPPLCDEFGLMRLCANRNEACAFGVVRSRPAGA